MSEASKSLEQILEDHPACAGSEADLALLPPKPGLPHDVYGPYIPMARAIVYEYQKNYDDLRDEPCLTDVWSVAEDILRTRIAEAVALAILAERERERDDPATTVYGQLLWRHMDAARKDFDGPERAKLFDLIEAYRAQFPDECAVWDARYSPERAGE